MRRVVALAVAAAAGLLLFAGCGGGGDSTEAATTTTPPIANLRIIFPEGLNVREMGERVAAVRQIAIAKRGVTPRLTRAQYLAAVKRAKPPKAFLADWKRGSMEGFLFPALYEFTQYTSGTELVADQLAAFRKNFAHVNLGYARSKNLTPYDVLKIASMIEKETVAPSERKLVAAVIYNRLHQKMPLGIDATLRYGLNIPGTESLTKAAIASDNPYNSRKFTGLPPTPVANPGLASIKAAAHPAPWTTSTTSGFRAPSGTSSRPARASFCARCASTGTPAAEAPAKADDGSLYPRRRSRLHRAPGARGGQSPRMLSVPLQDAVELERERGALVNAACAELDVALALDAIGDEEAAVAARARADAVLAPLGCVNPV